MGFGPDGVDATKGLTIGGSELRPRNA